MKYSYEALSQALQKMAENEPIEPWAIPNIDLYMDQVTSFMEEHLSGYKRSDGDKVMTKTMINNYTKDKLLPPPNKKKYSKNHIIFFILIYHLKQSLSMDDITKLLHAIPFSDAEAFYKLFLQTQKAELANLEESVGGKIKKTEEQPHIPTDNTALLLFILSLVIDANIKKQLATLLIDQYFSQATGSGSRKK